MSGMTEKKTKKYVKRKNASIFFVLWTVFSLFSLAIVFTFVFSQRYMLNKTYKERIAEDVGRCGKTVQRELTGLNAEDYSGLLYSRAMQYDMSIYVLTEDGEILFPRGLGEYSDEPYGEQSYDFSEKVEKLKKRLKRSGSEFALYEGKGEYVYGAKLRYGTDDVYLYVSESLDVSRGVVSDMTVRNTLVSVFVLVLSFAVAGAISGWLTKPLSEMTDKAKELARGNFSVDFRGEAYGSELTELAQALNFAAGEIGKADRMQKELIANVSHDFKTPLTMIKGYASMIKEISGNNPEKREKHAQIIIDETDRLTSLVTAVLDLSKIRSGIDSLEISAFDLSAYLSEIMEKFSYLSETKGYVFKTEIQANLKTRADKNKIGQVLYNLVGNAVNYTGEDNTVFVSLVRQGNALRFSVRDTGKGIKKEELPDIWDRYYRSQDTHKRPVQGTGLGLSIVKTVLEKHGFTFGVESEIGQGSTFYVLFPIFRPFNERDQ